MTEQNNIVLVDIEEAAVITKRSVSQIRKLLAAKMFVPKIDIGSNKHYFAKHDIEKWMQDKIEWSYGK